MVGRCGGLLLAMVSLGCAGEPAPEPTTGAEAEPVAVGETESAPVAVAPVEPPVPPDPHPVVAGFDRELRAWLSEEEAALLEGLELTGTADGETEKLTELIRHVLLRELGGPAILRLGIPEIRRYGEDIRAMPASPAGPMAGEEGDEEGEEAYFGGYGMEPHANIDGMGHVVGDLHGTCDSGLPEAERDERPNACDQRFTPVWATVKLANTAYYPLDVATMGFVDAGRPMGDGEVDQAAPMALRDFFALAERAGLERAQIVAVATQLLRDLVTFARDGEG